MSTRCSMDGTRRRAQPTGSSSTSRRVSRRSTRMPGSRPSAGATTRWTAIIAGNEPLAATRRSSTERASERPPRSERCEAGYARGENDEFILPTVVDGVDGVVRDGDPIVHANFRADRARQLTHALADADFDGFDRTGPGWPTRPARPARRDDDRVRERTAGRGRLRPGGGPVAGRGAVAARLAPGPHRRDREVRARDVLLQWRSRGGLARRGSGPRPESEGGDLRPAARDERRSASPTPLVAAIAVGRLRLHRGQLRQRRHGRAHRESGTRRIRALATIDACLGRVVDAVEAVDADDPRRPGRSSWSRPTTATPTSCAVAHGAPVTAHSLNPVPIVVVGRSAVGRGLHDGVLADVTPTILDLAGLPSWAGVVGRSLLEPVLPSDRPSSPRSERP